MPSGAKKRKAAKRKQQQAMDIPHPPPDSLTNPLPPQGNGGTHDHDPFCHDESSDHLLTDEEAEEEKEDPLGSAVTIVGHSMESSENGKGEAKEEGAVIPPSPPSAIPSSKSEDVHVEFVQPNEGEDGSGGIEGEPQTAESPTEIGSEKSVVEASVISIFQSDYVTEEVVQASEAIAVTSEVAVDSLPIEGEVKAVPLVQASEAIGAPSEVAVDSLAIEGEVKAVPLVATTVEQPRDTERPETAVTTEVTPTPQIEHRASWWNCCGLFDVLTGSQR